MNFNDFHNDGLLNILFGVHTQVSYIIVCENVTYVYMYIYIYVHLYNITYNVFKLAVHIHTTQIKHIVLRWGGEPTLSFNTVVQPVSDMTT
jgi:hypothetical protein